MKRRRFLSLPLAVLAAAVMAQNPFGLPGEGEGSNADLAKVIKPYLAVGPYADDERRVFMFISYDCPYCEQTWAGMEEWGRTLPEPFRFVLVPIFRGDKRMDAAATGFYVVRELAAHRLPEYNRLAFAAAKQARSAADFVQVLRRMGFGQAAIDAAVNKTITQNRIARAMMLVRRYRVTATPFFAVGGRYTTHAGFTGGSYPLLAQLLNGLVSDVLSAQA